MRSTWWFGLFLFVVLAVSAAASASVPGLVPAGHAEGAVAPVDADANTTGTKDRVALDRLGERPENPETLDRVDENATHAIADMREATGTTTPELVAALPHHEHDAAPPRESRQSDSGPQSDRPREQEQPEDEPAPQDDEDGLAKRLVSLVPDTPHAPPLAPLLPAPETFRLDPPTFDPPTNEAPPTARGNERVSPQPLATADAAPVAAPNISPAAIALAGVAAVTVAAAAAGTGAPSSLLAWLRRVFWLPLYARVAKDKVLDHGTRQDLLDRLRAAPGSCVAELQAASGVSLNTIRHHLRVMQANGVVTSVKQGRRRCFFPLETGWSAESRVAAAAISARAPRRVFRVIKSRPGIAQQELAAALGVTPTSVAFHARRLQEAGVVRAERTGRVLVYYPAVAAL